MQLPDRRRPSWSCDWFSSIFHLACNSFALLTLPLQYPRFCWSSPNAAEVRCHSPTNIGTNVRYHVIETSSERFMDQRELYLQVVYTERHCPSTGGERAHAPVYQVVRNRACCAERPIVSFRSITFCIRSPCIPVGNSCMASTIQDNP